MLFICRFQAKPQQQAAKREKKKRLQKQEKRGYKQTHEVKQNESEQTEQQNDYSNNSKQHIKGRKRKKMYSANEIVTELSDYRLNFFFEGYNLDWPTRAKKIQSFGNLHSVAVSTTATKKWKKIERQQRVCVYDCAVAMNER